MKQKISIYTLSEKELYPKFIPLGGKFHFDMRSEPEMTYPFFVLCYATQFIDSCLIFCSFPPRIGRKKVAFCSRVQFCNLILMYCVIIFEN